MDYTYHFSMRRFSTIDHCLISGTLHEKALTRVEVLHEVDNTSDHDPLVVHLSLQMSLVGCASKVHTPRVAWVKASPQDIYNYRSTVSSMLSSIYIPNDTLLCTDLQCKDLKHVNAINTYANDITEACIAAARLVVPLTCSRQESRRIPGWSEQVQPLRDKSLFWHRLWDECGRPHAGYVADCMRRTRAAYHYCIRNVRKNEQQIVCERVADAMLHNDGRNFWAEIKRIKASSTSVSKSVDLCKSDTVNIFRLFAGKYREHYTSINYDNDEMQRIRSDLNKVLYSNTYSMEHVSVYDVRDAVSHLIAHKRDGCTGLESDHIINAGDDCLMHGVQWKKG